MVRQNGKFDVRHLPATILSMKLCCRLSILFTSFVILVSSPIVHAESGKILTDRDLIRAARTPFPDERTVMDLVSETLEGGIVLGMYHGVPVRMMYRCSDLCPEYTFRTIEFAVPFDDCAESGGHPYSLFNEFYHETDTFCYPKVLYRRKLFMREWSQWRPEALAKDRW
jgi:hypothetical protein